MVRRAACSFWFLSDTSHFSGSRSSAISSRSSRLSEIVFFFLTLIFRRHFHWYKVVNQFYGIQGYQDTTSSPPAPGVLQRSWRAPGSPPPGCPSLRPLRFAQELLLSLSPCGLSSLCVLGLLFGFCLFYLSGTFILLCVLCAFLTHALGSVIN